MKIFVCCLILIANVSDNSKASIESFLPANSNMLLEDITKSSDTSCSRPCKFNVKPRRCQYNFKIQPTIQEDGRTAITINDMIPGPAIHVCVNDIIVVEVQNKVPDQDIALHWHGVDQKETPYMDGVPMVTQCPIAYGSTYKYAFVASTPGTFFYHSDSVSHQSDGVYGALVVNQPTPLDSHSSLYDYDRSQENTLLISARFPELLTGNLDESSQKQATSLLINGDEEYSKFFMIPDFGYRLRLINAIAVECPVVISIDQHSMLVISSDGRPVSPVTTSSVLLYPGERMDVVVRATRDVGGYWVYARSTGACDGLSARAMLLYNGFNYTTMLENNQKDPETESNQKSPVYGQQLESTEEAPFSSEVKFVYLGIDKNIVKFKDTDNDFRYLSDVQPKKPFFPATLSLHEKGIVQINKKNFLYPNTPMLLNPYAVKSDYICKVGEEEKQQELQCVQVLDVFEGDTIEIALVNEGFGSNESYTFHMHGYTMQVLATWRSPDETPLSREDFKKMEIEKKIQRNTHNPPLKDTVTVPNKGFTIVRIRPEYRGSWMLECRSCGLFSLPAAIVINVAQTLPKSILDTLPKCGNYRPPDVLLN